MFDIKDFRVGALQPSIFTSVFLRQVRQAARCNDCFMGGLFRRMDLCAFCRYSSAWNGFVASHAVRTCHLWLRGSELKRHSCTIALYLCLILYVATKVLIMIFLAERAHVVRGMSRREDRMYWFNICYIIVIVVIGIASMTSKLCKL